MMAVNTKPHPFTHLLHEELRVAMGCTEPIALAWSAAYAREVLGQLPERYTVACSGNIIKNVKAVTVPNTGGLKGIEASLIAGAVGGDAGLELEVLSSVTEGHLADIHTWLKHGVVDIKLLETPFPLHIVLEVTAGSDHALVELVETHSTLGRVERNGELLHEHQPEASLRDDADRQKLSVRAILEYADTVDLSEIREVLERQIQCNTAISAEGFAGRWGECVGRCLLDNDPRSLRTRLKAAAAAASDARMNGCALPVVINSGSGNQGITASLPVIEYAVAKNAPRDRLLRALCVSNLLCIHQKTGIGPLSAYCGALSAATGAAAGIAYLDNACYNIIANTIINSLANVGGMVCDGAKSSCAAKIASALESALLGYDMAKCGSVFRSGEGIVKVDVESTIASVSRMASSGMRATDIEILNIMIDN